MSMTETLLARGVGEDALGDVGNTPLIKAAREGHDGVVSRLLAAGADVFIEHGLLCYYPAVVVAIQHGHVWSLESSLSAWDDGE